MFNRTVLYFQKKLLNKIYFCKNYTYNQNILYNNIKCLFFLQRTPQWNTSKYIDLNKEEIKLPSNINVTPEKTPQLKPANTTPQFGGNVSHFVEIKYSSLS